MRDTPRSVKEERRGPVGVGRSLIRAANPLRCCDQAPNGPPDGPQRREGRRAPFGVAIDPAKSKERTRLLEAAKGRGTWKQSRSPRRSETRASRSKQVGWQSR